MRNYILIFLISVLLGCNSTDTSDKNKKESNTLIQNPIDTLGLLVGNYWNLSLLPTDSNYKNLNKKPLYFYGRKGYFNGIDFATISIKNDTLYFIDTSYQVMSSKPDKQVIRTEMIAKIETINSDTLILSKIKGWKLPFYINSHLKFYNDSLDFTNSYRLNKISFSTGLCYGRCPQLAIEIHSNGKFKFLGKKHSEIKGFNIGQIDSKFLDSLNILLNQMNIEKIDNYFPVPIDAPKSDLIINYNDSLTAKFEGKLWDGPPRFKNLLRALLKSYLKAELDTTSEKLEFETISHIENNF